MTEKLWKSKLKKDCKALGTYKPEFEAVIDSASKILAERDAVYQQFVDEGCQHLIIRITDRGKENKAKNPLLSLWKDLNDQGITFLRELGLSPRGYKAITDEIMKQAKPDALTQALKELS